MKDKLNNFLNTLGGKLTGAVIGLIVVFLLAKWDYVVATFDKGKSIETQIVFNSNLKEALKNDSIVISFMENENFVRLLFESETVKKHISQIGVELHDKIVVDVSKNDTNKVSMRSFIGMGAEIRDEQVLPMLTEIVKAWKNKEVLTKKDIDEIVRKSRTAVF